MGPMGPMGPWAHYINTSVKILLFIKQGIVFLRSQQYFTFRAPKDPPRAAEECIPPFLLSLSSSWGPLGAHVTLCRVASCHFVLWCVMSCWVVLCCVVSCCVMSCHIYVCRVVLSCCQGSLGAEQKYSKKHHSHARGVANKKALQHLCENIIVC